MIIKFATFVFVSKAFCIVAWGRSGAEWQLFVHLGLYHKISHKMVDTYKIYKIRS